MRISYSIQGDAWKAKVMYIKDGKSYVEEQVTPWTTNFAAMPHDQLYLAAQKECVEGDLTVRITVNGEVVREETVTAPNAVVGVNSTVRRDLQARL
jgi:hypothetical protein